MTLLNTYPIHEHTSRFPEFSGRRCFPYQQFIRFGWACSRHAPIDLGLTDLQLYHYIEKNRGPEIMASDGTPIQGPRNPALANYKQFIRPEPPSFSTLALPAMTSGPAASTGPAASAGPAASTGPATSIQTISAEMRQLHTEMADLKGQVANLQEEVETANEDWLEFHKRVTGLKEELASLKGEVEGLRAEVASLREDDKQLRQQVSFLEKEIAWWNSSGRRWWDSSSGWEQPAAPSSPP
jgi:outer membrane murein-binding lipoprotein Lpp